MKDVKTIAFVMFLSAGSVCAIGSPQEVLQAGSVAKGKVIQVAHIYYHLASGERIVTLLDDMEPIDQASQAAEGSVSIWANMFGLCEPHGGSLSSMFFIADDNSQTSAYATGATTVDFGDIPINTVVDCVHINWITGHDDFDFDSDGIADGVPGLSGQWTWWDADNGRMINQSTRQPLITLEFWNLPGNMSGPGTVSGYSIDVDLGGMASSSMTFEIGDTDGDLQGASTHNAFIGTMDNDLDGLPDSDLDGDGLFDWGWSVRFFQPGTADLDGDGVLDGDFADSMHPVGINFGAPEGVAIDNGDGTWSIDFDESQSDFATGSESGYVRYDQAGNYGGMFWPGPLSCTPGEQVPFGGFAMQLFQVQGSTCSADLNGDGMLNFFDISLFLQDFVGPNCDYNNDGVCDFFDVSAFLADFSNGCVWP